MIEYAASLIAAFCLLVLLQNVDGFVQTSPLIQPPPHKEFTGLNVLFDTSLSKIEHNGARVDIFKTLELKDEALVQAQSAVNSLESALDSAVSNLENLQGQLQFQVVSLENELSSTRLALEETTAELQRTQTELLQSQKEFAQLSMAYEQSFEAAARADKLEAYINTLNEEKSSQSPPKKDNNPWQIWSTAAQIEVPTLNEWIAIKGANEGEIQISGKVGGHPVIPDGDAIVTSPVTDPIGTTEGKIITTLSGSKYKLGTAMSMPSAGNPSQKITSGSKNKRRKPLTRVRSSISLPDLTGNTLGNGKYLLAGESVSSTNGRSFIQTVYRASSLGKPVGEPLIIKYSPNKEAMKREYYNYQRVSASLKRGNFIRRVEFMANAGNEVSNMSALVMQRGVSDVKAFMPKVGGKLDGELLLECALATLKCMEALHSVKLVWNDLKTENFVVIEDERGGVSFRGIDLESCMPVKSNPIDYTPEACPPEFATSFLSGEAESFQLEFSYDVWSYGMLLYEVATGRGFFDGTSAQKITKELPSFVPNINDVQDPVIADLISQCLVRNPRDRLTVSQIRRHEFFSSVNKNPFDFLFGS